jgi:hypothetical protein
MGSGKPPELCADLRATKPWENSVGHGDDSSPATTRVALLTRADKEHPSGSSGSACLEAVLHCTSRRTRAMLTTTNGSSESHRSG